MRKNLFSVCLFLCPLSIAAQTDNIHEQSDGYEWPTDTLVVHNLRQWQDLKFGVLLHWGLYAVPGIVESWSICDEPWIRRDTTRTYQQYLDWYWGLAEDFRPTRFDATQWATVCRDAGMRYMIFTTKHHDGFCMFDSRETNFSIARHAFKDDPRRDVLRHVLDAFREKNFTVGTYFSKPDWHSQDYWWDVYGKKGRNVNYSVEKFPHRWARFKDFTQRQIREILSRYGQVDILWLDGGWVRPEWSLTDETREWLGCYQRIQDVDMSRIAAMARDNNPDLIIVDRSVGGRYENYRTPEQQVPDSLLPYPWETCMSMGYSWSYVATDEYKSSRQLVHILIDIVAKGGNFLLNVGPDADGQLPEAALQRMKEMGLWLQKYGYAIYNTRPLYPYAEGNVRYTQSKDGKQKYAITLQDDGEFATVKKIK